jgi:Fe-S cluster assembly protein SufD
VNLAHTVSPQNELPHRRMEAWKWSDVRAALAKTVPATGTDLAPLELPAGGVILNFIDGVLQNHADLPDEVHFGDVGKADFDEALPMAALANTQAPNRYRLHIGASMVSPIVLRFSGQGPACLEVVMKAGSAATIIEEHTCQSGFANVALRYALGASARLLRLVYQQGDASAVQVLSAKINLGASARLEQFALSFGARLARLETRLSYGGENARARLNGAYLLDDERHSDQTFHVDHEVENCITRQLVRGMAKDQARAVFQGKFYVGRDGQHTNASMNHDALLLNAGASIHAKPELEIYADDVACAHGNTTGALDENALFYMRQRGLDEGQAKALLIRAFLGAAFDGLEDEALHDMLMAPVQNWLEEAL